MEHKEELCSILEGFLFFEIMSQISQTILAFTLWLRVTLNYDFPVSTSQVWGLQILVITLA